MRETIELPTGRCDGCEQLRPAFGFVNLTSEEGGPSRSLCSECYNRGYMKHAGLPELETVYFEPIIRCDSVGREHTFHFVVHMSTGLGIRAFECEFRLECFDACEAREITPDPVRPNPILWMPELERPDPDDDRHH